MVDAVQQPPFTLPVYHLARVLGIPSHFVEMRHTATHETLPSLDVLRECAAQARAWLWKNYWKLIPIQENKQPAVDGMDEVKVKDMFREWRRLRRVSPNTESSEKEQEILDSIRDYLTDNEERFIGYLISLSILIPTAK